jgi:hypothetical protein
MACPVNGERFVPSFDDLTKLDAFELPGDHLYGLLMNVGRVDGWPVITFTTKNELPIGAPSEAHLKIIAAGLKQTYPNMTPDEICTYLLPAEGIRNRIPAGQLLQWVQQA